MKKLLFFITTLFIHYDITKAQTVQWLDTINYSANNSTSGIGTDSTGNVYTTGSYSRGRFDNTSPQGIFISKYDSLGNLIWLDTICVGSAIPIGIVVDKYGNSYISVRFSGLSISFGSFTIPHTVGNCDMILVKYNSLGSVVWAKRVTNANPSGIYKDKHGIIYVLGQAKDTARFGSYSTGVNGNFIAKYDSNGNCLTAFSTSKEIINISCDASGNMFVVDRAGFSYPFYLKKYNSSGALLWTKSLAVGGDIYTDNNGNCYLSGGFYSYSLTLGTTTLTNPNTSTGSPQWFIAKTDPNGNYLWAFTPYDTMTIHGFCLGESKIYLTGNTGNSGGAYMAKYDTNGVFVSRTDFMPKHTGVHVKEFNSNTTYLTGGSWDGGNIFISKISKKSITTNVKDIENISNLHIYPNPTQGFFQIEYVSLIKGMLQINITDANGKIVYTQAVSKFEGEFKTSIDLSRQAKGVYFIEINLGKNREVKKIVLN